VGRRDRAERKEGQEEGLWERRDKTQRQFGGTGIGEGDKVMTRWTRGRDFLRGGTSKETREDRDTRGVTR
jgi:hypothetical protein